MLPDHPGSALPRSGDEMREEFRTAQRRRLLKRGGTLCRDTDPPHDEPVQTELPRPGQPE